MSRIRSIHPGLWTSEAFMSVSAYARLLLIGIWTEAWDDGVFEWKPLTLKARIFPADNVDVVALLEELVGAGRIRREEIDGRQIGLVRNFREHQRPKKPNESGLLRAEWRNFVGLKADGSEPIPHQTGTDTEISPQMEDGGGRMEEEGGENTPAPTSPGEGARDEFDQVWETFPRNPRSNRKTGRAAYAGLTPHQRGRVLLAAKNFATWFADDCKQRKRTVEAGLPFAPALANWLLSGEWQQFVDAPAAPVAIAMTRLDRFRDADVWRECERILGKKAPTSDGTWAFPAETVDQAKANIETRAA